MTTSSWLISLAKGLLFGIGFVAAVAMGLRFADIGFQQPIAVTIIEGDEARSADFSQDLTIVSHLSYKEKSPGNQLTILGKIRNKGDIVWSGIELQAELFNKEQYVDECVTFIRHLPPGAEDNFKITCGECDQDTLPPYDKMTLKVAAAHHDDT